MALASELIIGAGLHGRSLSSLNCAPTVQVPCLMYEDVHLRAGRQTMVLLAGAVSVPCLCPDRARECFTKSARGRCCPCARRAACAAAWLDIRARSPTTRSRILPRTRLPLLVPCFAPARRHTRRRVGRTTYRGHNVDLPARRIRVITRGHQRRDVPLKLASGPISPH
jgi:hypothetical protein